MRSWWLSPHEHWVRIVVESISGRALRVRSAADLSPSIATT
jgi:hypothetical protein